jgi:uncharacterized protein
MKNIYLSIILLLSFIGFSQTTVEEIRSLKLNANREITVKLPPSYAEKKDKKYPLLLVLDGEYLFKPFEGNIAYANYWDDMPEVIIVAISQNKNNERYDDTEMNVETGLPSDKGGLFFEFIASELMPYLQKMYRVAPFKIIAGLDSTAGFINSFLYKEIPQFNGYIVLSPELATEMEVRVPTRLAAAKTPTYYYLATADGDLKKFQGEIKLLDKNISLVKNQMSNYKFDDFKSGSHYSLVLNAIPNALYHIFSAYQPISNQEYADKIEPLKDGQAEYLKNKYDIIEKALGIKMNIRLNDFSAIESAILKSEAYNEFEQLAQLSGVQYPKSMLYDYHMGMYYEKRGDNKRALLNYQNAFIKEEIRDLTKDMMMNKAADIKKLIPVKPKGLKGGKAKEIVEDVPVNDTPSETPTETPTETPKEEQKPK